MKSHLPIKKLAQSNVLMAVVSCGILGVFLFPFFGTTRETVFVVLQSFVNILAISFLHILIIINIAKFGGRLSFKKKRIYGYILGYLITILYSFCIAPVREIFADQSWMIQTFPQQIITIIVGGLINSLIIIIMHNLIIAYQAKNDAEYENAELKIANVEAYNLLLRQQIHPHFLFNALSTLKTLYKTDAVAGESYIVHLSNFLRAGFSNNSSKLVTLSDELKLCTDYIAMQQIRFGTALNYKAYVAPFESMNAFVPLFSLQPLLENAIKHNDVTDEQPLSINIFIDDGYIVVENNLQRKKQPEFYSGNGLANLAKRYQLISGHEIIIKEENKLFAVRLKILER